MNSLNNTNYPSSSTTAKHGFILLRAATAIVAGSVVAFASALPVSAAPPTSKAKKTTHTVKHSTTRHHTTTRRRSTATRTRVASASKPKSITIHGYADTHPYERQVSSESPRINVTVGRTTTQTTSKGKVFAEGHGADKGGVIQNDGSVVPGPTSPGLPGANPPAAGAGPLVTAPVGGYGTVGAPPIIVDTPPVVTTPVPTTPVVPTTPTTPTTVP